VAFAMAIMAKNSGRAGKKRRFQNLAMADQSEFAPNILRGPFPKRDVFSRYQIWHGATTYIP
jgi:hypothetical protein